MIENIVKNLGILVLVILMIATPMLLVVSIIYHWYDFVSVFLLGCTFFDGLSIAFLIESEI